MNTNRAQGQHETGERTLNTNNMKELTTMKYGDTSQFKNKLFPKAVTETTTAPEGSKNTALPDKNIIVTPYGVIHLPKGVTVTSTFKYSTVPDKNNVQIHGRSKHDAA